MAPKKKAKKSKKMPKKQPKSTGKVFPVGDLDLTMENAELSEEAELLREEEECSPCDDKPNSCMVLIALLFVLGTVALVTVFPLDNMISWIYLIVFWAVMLLIAYSKCKSKACCSK
ncbi:MAG: hypothetical protein ABII22_01985 [Candidatus Micrarchaeota archaeon]